MTRAEAEQLINQRGLTVWANVRNGDKHIMQCMDDLGINVFVDYESDEFSIEWMIPQSIFRVTSGKMSPFSRDDHYNKMMTRMKEIIFQYRN